MTLSDIKSHIFRRTKTNATSFPAADMVIAINNAIERVESKIRPWHQNYDFTRFTTSDLSTGTAAPKFYSRFHELVPLWAEYQYFTENGQEQASLVADEIKAKEYELELWYSMRNYRLTTVTIASPGVFTLDNHGFVTNDRVILETSSALPTGLSAETWYYVIYATAHTFQLAATRDGAAINTSGSQSGSHFIGRETQLRLRPNLDSNK